MRGRAIIGTLLLIAVGIFLGGTVLREQVAYAAQTVDAVIIGPLDSGGNVKVHEQGTANVNVTNANLAVHEQQATQLVATVNLSAAQSLQNVNVAGYKTIRIGIDNSRSLCGGTGGQETILVRASEPGDFEYLIGVLRFCQDPPDSDVVFDVPGRTLSLICSFCPNDAHFELAIFGRSN